MKRIISMAAGLAMAGAAMLTAQEVERAPRYALQGDPDGGIWVVDQVKGLVSRCLADDARAPRVVDIDFGMPVPRARRGAGAEPICTDWAAVKDDARVAPKILGTPGDLAGGTFSGQ